MAYMGEGLCSWEQWVGEAVLLFKKKLTESRNVQKLVLGVFLPEVLI